MLKKNIFLFSLCFIRKVAILAKNETVHLLKQGPASNIIKYGLIVNLYIKIGVIDQLYFFSQNHRQRYIMVSIYGVRGPFHIGSLDENIYQIIIII